MRKKFLHVALIVVSMAVICCVSAFAADKPYGYPDDIPMVPDAVSDHGYILIRPSDGSRSAYAYSDRNVNGSFTYDGSSLKFTSSDGPASVYYRFLESSGWADYWMQVSGNSTVTLSTGTILYSTFDLYNSYGDLVYSVPVPPPPDPYENFWSDLKEVGTGVLGWAGNVASTITAEPVLLFTVGIFILGAAIGIFRRLLVRG